MKSTEKRWFSEERKIIADQIRNARNSERKKDKQSYGIDKSGKECLYRLGGLEHFFDYLRTLPSNRVLDIGVGTGRGSSAIRKMPISNGLEFEVTALRNIPELQKNFPKERIHITAVETLRGVTDKSLAGIIAVNSIGYSDHSLLAVRRLNQVLIPGGVVKATFYRDEGSEKHNGTSFKDPTSFIEAFSVLGYDVSPIKKFSATGVGGSGGNAIMVNSIIVAIKPGNPNAPGAKELLEADWDNVKSQAKNILAGGHLIFNTEG